MILHEWWIFLFENRENHIRNRNGCSDYNVKSITIRMIFHWQMASKIHIGSQCLLEAMVILHQRERAIINSKALLNHHIGMSVCWFFMCHGASKTLCPRATRFPKKVLVCIATGHSRYKRLELQYFYRKSIYIQHSQMLIWMEIMNSDVMYGGQAFQYIYKYILYILILPKPILFILIIFISAQQ